MYYSFNNKFNREIVASISKLFRLLLKNKNSAKWLGRNLLDELGSVFVVIMLADEDERKKKFFDKKDEEIKDQLIEGLGEMFKHEETVLNINKSTYISNWIFNNLLQICSKSYENIVQYISWISSLLEFEESANSSLSKNNHSNFLTKIINTLMAELSLRDYQRKQTFLNFRGQIDPKKQRNLFEKVVEMFEFATKNKKILKNLIDFREKNGFDLYFRYLAELSRWEFDELFC